MENGIASLTALAAQKNEVDTVVNISTLIVVTQPNCSRETTGREENNGLFQTTP